MNWGTRVNRSACRLIAALIGLLVLSACQPSLKSQLPAGTAAYQSIDATAQPAPPSGPYLLRSGDHVAVNVYQEAELTQPDLAVDEAGSISLPLIGEVHAAGRSTTDVAADIQHAYGARYLRDPKVNVALRESRARTYAVEGQVGRPGQFPYEPGTTLRSAVAVAGSTAETAKLDEVLVFRTVNGQRMGGRFDLTAIRAGREPDPQVLPGDVVVVGFSQVRGIYRDFLQTLPALSIFRVF